MSGRGLFIELGGSVAPRVVAVQHIEFEIGAAFFHGGASWGEPIGRLSGTLNFPCTAEQPMTCIEAAVLNRSTIAPIQLLIGQHAKHGALCDAMTPSSILSCGSKPSVRIEP